MTKAQYIERPIKAVLVGLVRFYRGVISPLLPPACRFYPSCSQYALDALEKKSLPRALWLILRRLARCQPFCRGGYDPVE